MNLQKRINDFIARKTSFEKAIFANLEKKDIEKCLDELFYMKFTETYTQRQENCQKYFNNFKNDINMLFEKALNGKNFGDVVRYYKVNNIFGIETSIFIIAYQKAISKMIDYVQKIQKEMK
jgi:hypothetical protein